MEDNSPPTHHAKPLYQNKIQTQLFLPFFYATEFLGYRAFLLGLSD